MDIQQMNPGAGLPTRIQPNPAGRTPGTNPAADTGVQGGRPMPADEQRVAAQQGTRTDEARQAEQRRQEAIARRESERENVIAVSEDGDTLQVEGDRADNTNEGIGTVVAKSTKQEDEEGTGALNNNLDAPEITAEAASEETLAERVAAEEEEAEANMPPEEPEALQAEARRPENEPPEPPEGAQAALEAEIQQPDIADTAEKLAEKDAQRFDRPVNATYAGISDDRLEQMYLDGTISRYDYESEIEARKDARQQLAQDNKKIDEDINRADRDIREMDRFDKAVTTATSDRTANQDFAVSAEERLDAMERVNEQNRDNARREEDNNRTWQYQQSLA